MSNRLLIQVRDEKAIDLEASMQDAWYLRSQAELCLQIARALSDYKAAENLRAVAAQNFVRTLEAEVCRII